jgi:hypothetical protein
LLHLFGRGFGKCSQATGKRQEQDLRRIMYHR